MNISDFIKNGANKENNFGYEDFRADDIFNDGGVEAEKLAENGKMLYSKLIEFLGKFEVKEYLFGCCFEVGNVIRIVSGSDIDIRLVINEEQNDMFDVVRVEIGGFNGGLVMDYSNISYKNSFDFHMVFSVIKASQE